MDSLLCHTELNKNKCVSRLARRKSHHMATVSVRCLSVCDVRALCPNDWTDQDETWHAGRPRPWPHCVRWKPSSPSRKRAQPPIFGPYLLRPNGYMDQDVTWGSLMLTRFLFKTVIFDESAAVLHKMMHYSYF